LHGTEIVAISQLDEERFEDGPVPVTRCDAELALQMALEIILNAIVVQQRVVHVNEEDEGDGGHEAFAIVGSVPPRRAR
jgi:hypothetical protein